MSFQACSDYFCLEFCLHQTHRYGVMIGVVLVISQVPLASISELARGQCCFLMKRPAFFFQFILFILRGLSFLPSDASLSLKPDRLLIQHFSDLELLFSSWLVRRRVLPSQLLKQLALPFRFSQFLLIVVITAFRSIVSSQGILSIFIQFRAITAPAAFVWRNLKHQPLTIEILIV